MAKEKSWDEQVKQQKNKSKSDMYKALKKNPSIVRVEVTYDGSGDNGNIEPVIFFNKRGKEIVALGDLEDRVANYVCDHLPGGWEINDGSWGTCTIDVVNKKAHFNHNDRIEASENNPFDD